MSAVMATLPTPFFPSIDCWLPLTPHHNPLVLRTDKPSCNSKKGQFERKCRKRRQSVALRTRTSPACKDPLSRHLREGQQSQHIFLNPCSKVWSKRWGVLLYLYFHFQRNLGWGMWKQSRLKCFCWWCWYTLCLFSDPSISDVSGSAVLGFWRPHSKPWRFLSYGSFSSFFLFLARVIWCRCPQSHGNGNSKHFLWPYSGLPRGKKWRLQISDSPCICSGGISSSKGSQLVKIVRAKTTQLESNFS